jgi:hypothetical protein
MIEMQEWPSYHDILSLMLRPMGDVVPVRNL